jgi:4-carboxymuconolactone decarboxylase
MTRLAPLTLEGMTGAQREVYDEFSAAHPRVGVAITHLTWMRSPELASLIAKFGSFLRYRCMDYRKRELAIMITGRAAKSPVEWYLHLPFAREAGIEEHILTALTEQRRPDFTNDEDAALYDVVTELMAGFKVSDATYQRATTVLGSKQLVELVAITGYYVMMAMQIGTFKFEMPPGEKPAFAE